MKTYTATYQLESPKTQKIWVPQFSDYKIGIAVTRGGEDAEGTLVVKDGSTTLSADAEKTSIWTTYTLKSQAPGYSELSIEWKDAEVSSKTAVFKLIRAVTDSSTFENGGAGGGSFDPTVLSDYATKDELSDYASKDELSDYASKDELSDYASKDELSDYASKNELSDYASKNELSGYAQTSSLAISASGNLSAQGMTVGMKDSIEIETAKAERISADMLSGIAVRGASGTFTDITCSNTANIASLTTPYLTVGDGATAGTFDASNSTATFCEKDAVHDPNSDIVVKKYNSTSQQYDSYSLGVHTLSGTYDDEGKEVEFSWKILANVVA